MFVRTFVLRLNGADEEFRELASEKKTLSFFIILIFFTLYIWLLAVGTHAGDKEEGEENGTRVVIV